MYAKAVKTDSVQGCDVDTLCGGGALNETRPVNPYSSSE